VLTDFPKELQTLSCKNPIRKMIRMTGEFRNSFLIFLNLLFLLFLFSTSRLNCAILNDSFVLSPSKEFEFGNTPCRKGDKSTDENNKNLNNQLRTIERDIDSGFISRVSNMKMTEELLAPMTDEAPRPLKSRTQLFPTKSVLQDKPVEASVPSVFRKSLQKEPETPKLKALECSLKVPELDTPLKKIDHVVFATPSLRPAHSSFSVATAKKTANLPVYPQTCEKRDKPQAKILFTTPVARPPPGSFMESSTPIEIRKQITQHRKLSPIKEPSTEKEKPNERTISINGVDYVIDKKIGSGGSSSVFLARGKKSGKEFAIKLVTLDGDQQVIDGYLNETKLLAKLQGNINVVSLFDYCHLPEKSSLYMVMEKGESDLHKILQGYRTHIPLYTLVSFWYQMLQAVNYIHQNGVIHSDLKPANFLMIDGRLKLIDFGIASNIAIDSTSIIKFSQAGTFNYISPEALIDTSNGDSPSTHHQPKIRLSTKSDVSSNRVRLISTVKTRVRLSISLFKNNFLHRSGR
jgi:serine/threonine-protein kinase TTK/MPS1